jgi:threonine synthase
LGSLGYVSTRGAPGGSFSDILLEGLAPDGGLFVPERLPTFAAEELSALSGLPYAELAARIISRFAPEWDSAELGTMSAQTYTAAAFHSADVVPLRTLEPGLHVLGLSNGPTLAFKDVALQLLGRLFEAVLGRRGTGLNILGATSGDTGSAAEHAMRGRRGLRVFMLSPQGRMSPFQAAQMYSLHDPNIFNIAIRGVFDHCQDIVKAVSGDLAFKARHRIGTVNSINWARVAAQVVYYFKAYAGAAQRAGEPVSFAVPSGNFGNIYAGYLASRMGLPVRRLIVATNENNVLEEFFRTGRYRVRSTAEVHHTSSPSMDISKSSNFERLVYDALGHDAQALARLWRQLDTEGSFDLAGTSAWDYVRASGFVAGVSTHADRLATIREVHRRFGEIVDPHTADGIKVGLQYREPGVPLICLETALPVKFAATIREALGREPERPAGFEDLESKPQRVTVLDPDLEQVKAFIAGHST